MQPRHVRGKGIWGVSVHRGRPGCAVQSCSSASIPAPPARPGPRSPRLSPSAAAAFALIYISTQLQSRAPSPAGEGGQDRDGKITRGAGEGHPSAERAAFLGEGWCLHPNSAPSLYPSGLGPLISNSGEAKGHWEPLKSFCTRSEGLGAAAHGEQAQQRILLNPHRREGFLEVSKLCAGFPSQPGLGAKAGPQCRRCLCPPPLPQFPFATPSRHDPVQG